MSARPTRREYYNAPTMSWWERSYLPEIVRGLTITGGVFMRNMWRWLTLRKGALTTYYLEETRADRVAQPGQARADATPGRAPAVHRM
jgi:NADH-quinone oxidoreductase subunit I